MAGRALWLWRYLQGTTQASLDLVAVQLDWHHTVCVCQEKACSRAAALYSELSVASSPLFDTLKIVSWPTRLGCMGLQATWNHMIL